MIANIRARFSRGVIEPMEPLDMEEGQIVLLDITEAPDKAPPQSQSVLEIFDQIHHSAPAGAWDSLPADGAKNLDHYLYGLPKDGE